MTKEGRVVIAAPAGTIGFDCNTPLSAEHISIFRSHLKRFVARYVPRVKSRPADLSVDEVDRIMAGGLGLTPVQHVESETKWMPTVQKGEQYGRTAAEFSRSCGILPGTCCWLDLEGVDTTARVSDVMLYARRWHHVVASEGFSAGLYVGWHAGLNPTELYDLPFEHYWGAFNLNVDQRPANRGVQMQQRSEHAPPGIPFQIDGDVTSVDRKGGAPLIMVPPGWDVVD